jgi:hypothetical protein
MSQRNWRFCRKCRGLAFGEVVGVCPAPGPGHDYRDSFDYNIWFINSDGRQPGWKHCKNCQGMHYAPVVAQSRCPKGGPHITVGSGSYFINMQDWVLR